MYETSFQMAQRPFASAPTASAYVRTATHQGALENLVRCVERAEGVGVVVGPAGTGKLPAIGRERPVIGALEIVEPVMRTVMVVPHLPSACTELV